MSGKIPNRIAAEDISGLTTWAPPDVGGNARVLPSAEIERRQRERSEQEIIEDCDGEVDYAPMTADELQLITDAAEKEGFERGYQEGFAKGEADGRRIAEEKAEERANQQLGAQVSALLQVAEALVNPIAEQESQLENLILELVTGLTQQIVKCEMQLDSSQVLSAVKAAVAALPVGSEHITLYLNPDDLALVESYAEEHHKEWVFRSDPELLPGGCRISTRDSLVDFSVERRIDELFRQFLNRQLASSLDLQSDPASDSMEDTDKVSTLTTRTAT